MGALRTSEDAVVVAGEGKEIKSDDKRVVDDGAKIIIAPGPVAAAAVAETKAPIKPLPPRPQAMPTAPVKQGGLWIVILAYVLATAALGAAIYERFLA